MTTNEENLPHEAENKDSEIKSEENKTPEIAQKKVSRFGIGQFQNGSRFGKGGMNNFNNPINKQRPGRAAGRGR